MPTKEKSGDVEVSVSPNRIPAWFALVPCTPWGVERNCSGKLELFTNTS